MGEHFRTASEPRHSEQHEKLPQLEMALETISSSEHKERNEDAGYFKKEAGIFGVFDGIGGAPAGDLASRAAMMQLTKSAMEGSIKGAGSPHELHEAIETANTLLADSSTPLTEFAVKKAIRVILKRMAKAIAAVTESADPTVQEVITQYANTRYGKAVGHPLDPQNPADREIISHAATRIGTTVSGAKIWSDENGKRFVSTFQLGDSSVYRLRNGRLEKITIDDSFITSLQRAKLLPSEAEYEQQTSSMPNNPDYAELRVTVEAIRNMAIPDPDLKNIINTLPETTLDISVDDIRHYVTASMNNQQKGALMARITTTEILSGDVLIAMTDGITDNLTWGEIQSLAERKKNDPEQLAILLASYAGKRSQETNHPRAKPDDMTAVVVAIT